MTEKYVPYKNLTRKKPRDIIKRVENKVKPEEIKNGYNQDDKRTRKSDTAG